MIILDMNIISGATAQYDMWNFNSMLEVKGKYFGANSSGFYKITGNTADTVEIGAYLEPITTDFGNPNMKCLRNIYLGGEFYGDMYIKITADDKTDESRTYTIPITKTGQQRKRITITRALIGRYFTIQLGNVSGSDFSSDSIHVLPIFRHPSHT